MEYNRNLNPVLSFLSSSAGDICLYFFVLNLTSGLTFLLYSASFMTGATVTAIGMLIAYLSSMICRAVSGCRPIYMLTVTAFAFLFNIAIVLDYFMIINFHGIFNQDAVDVITDTNPEESSGFIRTYLSPSKLLLWGAAIAVYNILVWKACRICGKSIIVKRAILLTVSAAIAISGYCALHYVRYGSGMSVPQCNTLVRATYALHIANRNLSVHNDILAQCKSAEASSLTDIRPDIVVIIGESHSVYHSQLYGYRLSTEPLMHELSLDSGLTVFRDAISPWDLTIRAMHSVFSVAGAQHGLTSAPLFPALFKAAGYHTEMHDNQYLINSGVSILADSNLSGAMFDERNDRKFRYDSEMLSCVTPATVPSLYVIHLQGQHYTYADRCPEEQRVFSEKDYHDSILPEKRRVMAHYDNATLMTDRNLRSIIDKFQDRDCAVIYFSDHGEEIYEYDDMGHGFAAESKNPEIQLRVPLWIWLSPAYRANRPEIAYNVSSSGRRPVTTNDISQVILELGRIHTPYHNPRRSFISPDYDRSKKRIVLNSLDFDMIKARENTVPSQ